MTVTEIPADKRVPMVPWDTFMSEFVWNPGEHVGMIGPTGQGKTNFAYHFLPLHKFITVFGTKPRDKSLTAFGATHKFVVWKQWRREKASQSPRRILWPEAKSLYSVSHQRAIFKDAFAQIYGEGGWTLYLDELYFVVQNLGLGAEVKTYLLQARALDISLVAASQRPSWIPLEVYDQSTHLFFWRDSDKRNLDRLSGISFINADIIKAIISTLPQYHILYINTRTGDMAITRPPAPVKERSAK